MTAHLTKIQGGYLLYISPTARSADYIQCLRVSGKKQAREIATAWGAKAWDF